MNARVEVFSPGHLKAYDEALEDAMLAVRHFGEIAARMGADEGRLAIATSIEMKKWRRPERVQELDADRLQRVRMGSV